MSWKMPSVDEQREMLDKEKIAPGRIVRYRTGKISWKVVSVYVLSSGSGSLYVLLNSMETGTTRTARPWEVVAEAP